MTYFFMILCNVYAYSYHARGRKNILTETKPGRSCIYCISPLQSVKGSSIYIHTHIFHHTYGTVKYLLISHLMQTA